MKQPNFYENIEKVPKTRVEQEKDFKKISGWAKPGCQVCLGRGFSGWHQQLEQLLICDCVLRNIEEARAEENASDKGNDGVISKIRDTFKIN